MANLLGQNIGTNYKGILNLNTLNGNLSGTLESVTDGDGNASALQLSTSLSRISANLTIGGSTTASARLHVRGDGTNAIARFENSAGASSFTINAAGDSFNFGTTSNRLFIVNSNGNSTINGESLLWQTGITNAGGYSYRFSNVFNLSNTSGLVGLMDLGGVGLTFAAGAGSANFRPLNIAYTINNSGAQTGTATGIFLNATETALNGMTHNLMDLQRGGVSQFSVTNGGTATFQRGIIGTVQNNAINNFNNTVTMFTLGATSTMYGGALFQVGGTTNAFPALKRNGAALEVRLADDSATTALNAASFNTVSCTIGSNFMSIGGDSGFLRPAASTIAISLNGFSNNHFEFRKNSDTTVVGIIKGTGSPEGVITANQGSIFLRTDGGAGTSFYVKESGTGNTGWVAK